jgi:hypothetical protein
MEEAADEMERLSARGSCPASDNAAKQDILTDEERDVLAAIEADASYRRMEWTERVVRSLLDRLG